MTTFLFKGFHEASLNGYEIHFDNLVICYFPLGYEFIFLNYEWNFPIQFQGGTDS